MWLSEKLSGRERQDIASAEEGTVTVDGGAAVYSRGEDREVRTAAPAGFFWKPKNGERVLVIKGGTFGEDAYIVGKVQEADSSLSAGEIRLQSVSGTEIILHNSGRIDINGTLYINGTPYVPAAEG